MAADIGPLLADLRAEQADLAAIVRGADLGRATPAAGWDVRDALSHLAGTDLEAVLALTDPDAFRAKLPAVAADISGFLTGQLTERRALAPADLLAQWQRGLPQTFIRLSKVPEDRYSIPEIVCWIAAIFSRDFLDLVSAAVGIVVDWIINWR